jgi:hypothetical protein
VSTYQWLVLVYRVPSEPASRRVAVWRELKRLGALYLQQCVCILPRLGSIVDELGRVTAKIDGMSGDHTLFEVPVLRAQEVVAWLDRGQELLATFEEEVYRRNGTDEALAGAEGGGPPRLFLRDIRPIGPAQSVEPQKGKERTGT